MYLKTMRVFFLIGVLLLKLSALQAQYTPSATSSSVALTVGVVGSHLFSDTLNTFAHSAPSLGFHFTEGVGRDLFLRGSARFTTRGFNSDQRESRLRNRYLDLELNVLNEILPGLRPELGAAVHVLFESKFSYVEPALGYSLQSSSKTNQLTYLDGFVGLELRLQKGLALGSRYYPAVGRRQSGGVLVQVAVNIDEPLPKSESALEKERARRQITELRRGVLLVRLKTLEKSIEAMRRSGMPITAAETEQRVRDQNKELMEAFREEFSFCPVYFFYSHHSKEVKEGMFGEFVFDSRGEPADSLMFPGLPLFFADTGPLEADTSTHFYSYEMVQDGHFSRRRIRREFGGQAMGFGALVIKDRNMIPLSRPFPYYVKTWGHYSFLRSPKKFVALLDEKLRHFYHSAPGMR